MRRAIYPGSFDPVTNGHLDVIERAAKLFDEVIVAVASTARNSRFSPSTNASRCYRKPPPATVDRVRLATLEGLLVDYARHAGAGAIIRGSARGVGLRVRVPDGADEPQARKHVETIFLMPKEEYTYLSSRIIKEIARLGGDVTSFVPSCVSAALREKCPPRHRPHAMKIHLRQIPEEGLHLETEEPADFSQICPPRTTSGRSAPCIIRSTWACPATACGRRANCGVPTWNSSASAAWNRSSTHSTVGDLALQVELPATETVDLTPELREDILLALPAHPHCDWSGERVCPGRVGSVGRSVRPGLDTKRGLIVLQGAVRLGKARSSCERPRINQFLSLIAERIVVLWESPNAKPPKCACAPAAPPTAWHAPQLSRCPQCSSRVLPHIACPSCGYYNGRQVLTIEA